MPFQRYHQNTNHCLFKGKLLDVSTKYKPVSISDFESYLLTSSAGLNNDRPKLSQLPNMLVYCLFLSYATCPLFFVEF